MTRLQHLQAAVMAVILLVGGEVFFMTPDKNSLRGANDSFAEKIETKANATLKAFMKHIKEESLNKEELVSVIDRLKDIEDKIQEPQHKKQDIAELHNKVSVLDGKIKTHEEKSVNDEDLKALEARLSAFEAKMKDKSLSENDLVTLKEQMAAFEEKLQSHEDGIIKKEDLDILEEFIASMEKSASALDETAKNEPVDGGNNDSAPAPARKKATQEANAGSNKDIKSGTLDVSATIVDKKKTTGTNPVPRSATVPKLNAQEKALLGTFSPKNAPIMGRTPADIDNPIRTRVLLLSPRKFLKTYRLRKGPLRYISDEMYNIALDGLEKSPYFENLEPAIIHDHVLNKKMFPKEKKDIVWVVDSRNLAPRSYDSYSVDEEVLYAAQQTVSYQASLRTKPSLKVVFIDYRDEAAGSPANCGSARRALIKLLGEGNVRQVVGRIAVDRQWDVKKNWVDQGTVWNNQDYACSGVQTLYSPYTVRSDYVETVEKLFPNHLNNGDKNKNGVTPVATIRPIDVTYYWNLDREKDNAQLRNTVGEVIALVNGTMAGSRKITALTGTVGEGQDADERIEVSLSHVESLLTTKIVVVAQSDVSEDDYGLFEAFVGGAMVLTDPMLSLPAGLVDGENIVVYNSRDELKELLTYYLDPENDEARLEIARRGYEVAMGQHRSYHQMEDVFFGKALSMTTSSQPGVEMKKIDSVSAVTPQVHKAASNQLNQAFDKTDDSTIGKESPTELSKQELTLLETFNPEHDPILGEMAADINNPTQVRVLQMSPKKRKMRVREGQQVNSGMGLLGDEMINIVLDGFERSPYFRNLKPTVVVDHNVEPNFVLKEPKDVVWVVDSRNLTHPSYHYSVDEDVLIAAKATVKYQQGLKRSKKPSLKVVFFDYRDKLAGHAAMCSPEREELIKLLGVGNVRHVVGKVVAGRAWNKDNQWPDRGTIWENKDHECFGKATLRAAYTVRSDYAEAVERLYPKFLSPIAASKKKRNIKTITPVDTIRPLDVAHYWDEQQLEGREMEYRSYSQLRNAVSKVVSSLNGTMAGTRQISALAGTVSTGGSNGRTEVSDDYLEGLLTTKIVVVAQRDSWEDHYRLFEAFVGGAMVMTDLMIALPPGLVDGENIVMYRSLDELREKLLYYLNPEQKNVRLKIARNGYDVAMGQHRSYHRMEEVFFGKRLSKSMLPSSS